MGDIEQIDQLQHRAWSAVYRVFSDEAVLILKACSPALRHEAAITAWLSREWPDLTPEVLASSFSDGWLLMPYYPKRMREADAKDQWVEDWKQFLPQFGEMQRQLTDQRRTLEELGVPQRAPRQLPALLDDLLDQISEGASGVSPVTTRFSTNLIGDLRILCEQLAQAPVRPSLHHGDLHDGNIFLDGGRHRLLDWGDCGLSHPFFSLRTAFVRLEASLSMEDLLKAFPELKDAYLEPWSHELSRAELSELFDIAAKVWALPSALSWNLALSSLGPEEQGEESTAVPELLLELSEAIGDRGEPGGRA